jgi:hypothetical protein
MISEPQENSDFSSPHLQTSSPVDTPDVLPSFFQTKDLPTAQVKEEFDRYFSLLIAATGYSEEVIKSLLRDGFGITKCRPAVPLLRAWCCGTHPLTVAKDFHAARQFSDNQLDKISNLLKTLLTALDESDDIEGDEEI